MARRPVDPALAHWARSRVDITLDPKPGFWLLRAVKGGHVRVPARIWWAETVVEPGVPENDMTGTRSPFLAAEIGDRPVDLDRVWTAVKEPCTEAEWQFRKADMGWAKQWKPNEPIADPHRKIDPLQAPLPF